MILDLPAFVSAERRYWEELEQRLQLLEGSAATLTLTDVKRLHYLYERAASDLARMATFAAEPETRRYLEVLVARAYGRVHESDRAAARFSFAVWFFDEFPRTFRRHAAAFGLALAATVAGAAFGALAILLDPGVRDALMPFEGLRQAPERRVAAEEAAQPDRGVGERGAFSAELMTHNTRVAILSLALGMTFGVGTLVLLFYNGVILGAVVTDYMAAGQGKFLAGWLLPHGTVEIPAILIAGQAGLVLGAALLGRGRGVRLSARLRSLRRDLATLVAGAAVLLVWAGLVESFFSQDHEPRLSYLFKTIFGLVELLLLAGFLGCAGGGRIGNRWRSAWRRAGGAAVA